MFEKLRQSLDDLIATRASRPEERRAAAVRMKETLVLARVGLDDLRTGVDATRARLATERRELETVLRRKALAANVGDAETVRVAERFEQQHGERAGVLERKLAAQEEELALGERDVEQMTIALRAAIAGGPASAPGVSGAAAAAAEADTVLNDDLSSEIDGLGRQHRRAAHDALADERLAELKRRMGQ